MLERAAAGVESGKLHRVLPRTTNACRPSRAFASQLCRQQAAASATEAGHGACSRDCLSKVTSLDVSSRKAEGPETARPLDFLYPRPTHALLRNSPLNLSDPRPRKPPPSIRALLKRSSSSSPAPVSDIKDTLQDDSTTEKGVESEVVEEQAKNNRWVTDTVDPKDIYAPKAAKSKPEKKKKNAIVDEALRLATEEASRAYANLADPKATLRELFAEPEGQAFHKAWNAYGALDPEDQSEMRPDVATYLSKSQSRVELSRGMSLLPLVKEEQWTNNYLSGAVLLHLRSRDRPTAVEFFKRGVQLRGLVGGFEYLLLDAVNRQDWAGILGLWQFYYDHGTNPDDQGNRLPDQSLLDPLSTLPQLGSLYFALERSLSRDKTQREKTIPRDTKPGSALDIFRRRFAKEALRQGCPPRQAAVILKFWGEWEGYNKYLTHMFTRLYNKQISFQTARELLPIYRDLRKIDGAEIWPTVLKGVFQLHTDEAEIENLYQDWMSYHGELSHWAFDKFMNYYAKKGNINKVRPLWERCAKVFPVSVTRPSGFRSTMNAYAQMGDVGGAEKEMQRMMDEYKVEPDPDTWNILLKCYIRAGDEARTAEVFEKMNELEEADSFTYTHMMATAAKKGDVEGTLRYVETAQRRGIPVSKQMALHIVVAYCKSDRLEEAETICRELAGRGLATTAAWNQLILLNGLRGKLDQCRMLLDQMKKYRLEWDSQTISYLLMALTQVRQIYSAYQVVRDAAKNTSHLLIPDHFNIVLGGSIKINNRSITESLMLLMQEHHISIPFNALVAYTQGLVKTAPNTIRDEKLGQQLLESFDALANSPGDTRQRNLDTSRIAQAVKILIDLRDFPRAEQLLTKYAEMTGHDPENDVWSPEIIATLIRAYFRDGNVDRAHETWKRAWPKLLERSSRPDGEGLYPAHEWDMSMVVHQMIPVFSAGSDGQGLLAMVNEVLAAGFKFTTITWDVLIRNLARLGLWQKAMDFCEKMLMPNWRGWHPPERLRTRKRLDLEKLGPDKVAEERQRLQHRRWEDTNPRNLVPVVATVLSLQMGWLDARRQASWSQIVADSLDKMPDTHPLLYRAFTKSRYTDSLRVEANKGKDNLTKAIVSMLSPLTINELRWMRSVLEDQLKELPDQGNQRMEPLSPIHKRELVLLKEALSQSLIEKAERDNGKKAKQIEQPYLLVRRTRFEKPAPGASARRAMVDG